MNRDILKGKWQEIKGRVKEAWGKCTNNDPFEIEGKRDRLLGLLRKKYGYMKGLTELQYQDSVELVKIVSSIRGIMTKQNDATVIAFITRYGQPLLAQKQEDQLTEGDKKHGHDIDCYSDYRLSRRTTHLASQ